MHTEVNQKITEEVKPCPILGIITAKSNDYYYVLWSNGVSSSFHDLKTDFKKTGRNNASFEGLLYEMKEHRDE